jgi:hypothetical protein
MFHLSAIDDKIEQCLCIKFSVKPSKSAPEILKMFREAFGEHSGEPSSKTTENAEKI